LREVQLGLPPRGSCTFIRRWLELGIVSRAFPNPDNPVLAFSSARNTDPLPGAAMKKNASRR
jgi:hypothetical protein